MKILSPAGNLESLKMAVYNGADEVYLGINQFNARNNISGFDIDSLKEAVDFAHVFDVKVCLAINILFSDDEIQNALDVIVDSYNIGVDAFIIQDYGLVKLVHDNYPEVEIHASTQMGIHNLEGVKAIEPLGFKRAVLSRETPLDEIKRIRENCDLEIEYFVHGALCVSFSGNCYLSSYLCGASGNRGKCKQLCRLPYTLEKDGKALKEGYLLSAKDFNMSKRLKDLQDVGVDVLKIEGRARRPFYVGVATQQYYRALHGEKFDDQQIKLAFNRNFTEGYFNGNGEIISDIQNHVGIPVGKVTRFVAGKKFNEVFINSNKSLSEKSTFKFIGRNGQQTVLTAFDLKKTDKNVYKITTTQTVNVEDQVNLIIDAKLEDEVLSFSRKRKVEIDLYFEENKPLKAVSIINGNKIEVLGEVCQTALNQPLTKEQIAENFAKSELFEAKINIKKLDKVFVLKQKLNEFRRNVFDQIYKVLTNLDREILKKKQIKTDLKVDKFEDFQIVEKTDEKLLSKNIIYSPEIYSLQDISDFKEKCENQGKNFYLDTPNFALKSDVLMLKKIIEATNSNIVANNYYALTFDTNIVIGAGLNVYNTIAADAFHKPVVVAESDIANRVNFAYMTLRHCPMKSHMLGNCQNCPYKEGFEYKMQDGKRLKLKRKKLTTCTFYLTD